MESVSLTSAQRTSVYNLQETNKAQAVVQNQLATRRVQQNFNIVSDFISQRLSDRASDLAAVKNNISSGLQTLQVASNGLSAIEDTLQLSRAVASEYEATDDPDRRAQLAEQFSTLQNQINGLAADSNYGGTNLIATDPQALNVSFSDAGSGLNISGLSSSADSLNISLSVDSVDAALEAVRNNQATIGTNASILENRSEFTTDLANVLNDGAAQLVETDINEDAAAALSLETREQLGVASLAITNQSQQSIMQLF